MNWYLERKAAWNWRSMLPSGGNGSPQPIAPKPKPSRSRGEIEADKKKWLVQMNFYGKGGGKTQPDAAQKYQQAKARYDALLQESEQAHAVGA